ncbi:hypothetical protein R6G00_05830 [Streptomyces roseofulvus]|uniref:DhaL domain-containing protein n=2 Tax=Streptomyces TaxID=1883 RepID=A0ABU4K1R6_9ACTN|nr:hypothetical protein [Streptomyces roseolus]
MELVGRALPAIEEHADQAAESACLCADAVSAGGWSTVAADDALTAIETLAEALGGIGPELQDVLAAATAAASTARRRMGLPVDTEPEPAAAGAVPSPCTGRRPRRRGLGHGFKGGGASPQPPLRPRLVVGARMIFRPRSC